MQQPDPMIIESFPAIKAHSDRHVFVRRLALFLSMLISGGLLLFPRIPILIMVILLGLAAAGFRVAPIRRTWPVLFLLVCVLVITLVRPGPIHFESLAIRYVNFICALVLLNVYLLGRPIALATDLYVILRWMAFQAIVTVVLANTLSFLFTTINFDKASFKTILLLFNYHAFIEDASGLLRPDGFFYEPGVFQIYLNIYLYLTLFIFRSHRQAFLAVLAVFSTQSTTGVLIAMILLSASFYNQLKLSSFRGKLLTLLFALMVAPPVIYLGYSNVTDKLYGEAQGSSWAREYDFYTGLNVIAAHPLLGIGFDHQRYASVSGRMGYDDTQLSIESLVDRPTSNGLIYLCYTSGLPFAFIFFIGFFRQKFFQHRLLIGLLLTLSLFGEAIIFTPFILMIIFSAFISYRKIVISKGSYFKLLTS